MAGFWKGDKSLALGQMEVRKDKSGATSHYDCIITRIGEIELVMSDVAASELSYWLRAQFDYGKPHGYSTIIEG